MCFTKQSCHGCREFGISCEQRNWLDSRTMRGVSSVIRSSRLNRDFECLESINNCPIILGRSNISTTADKIKSTIREVSDYVIQPVLVSRSSNKIKFPGLQ